MTHSNTKSNSSEQLQKQIDCSLELAIKHRMANDFESTLNVLTVAIKSLQELLNSPSPPDDMVALYGVTIRSCADIKHQLGDDEAALAGYTESGDVLTSLASKGDGEAKFELATTRFHRGYIYHVVGDFEKAASDFEAAFLTFRALEKISDVSDTRLLMAKVSIAQADLERDRGAPVTTTDDLYNRAMRLLVELIEEDGQTELEPYLVNALISRCETRFNAHLTAGITPNNVAVFDPILVDMRQAIDILERRFTSGESNMYELFDVIQIYGSMLLDLERFDEAAAVLTPLTVRFPEVFKSDNPVTLARVASLHDTMATVFCQRAMHAAAINQFTHCIQARKRLLTDHADTFRGELAEIAYQLAMTYMSRIIARQNNGDKIKDLRPDAACVRKLIGDYLGESPEDVQELKELLKDFGV